MRPAVLITKLDLLPYLPTVRLDAIVGALDRVMPRPRYIGISATTGVGIESWIEWLTKVRVVRRPQADVASIGVS